MYEDHEFQEPNLRVAPSPEAPIRFGNYELIKRLGYGGMAEVFLATRAGVGGFKKKLVIKRLLPHLLEDARTVEMFIAEARLAAEVQHKNIVEVFGFDRVEGGELALAMEFVDGCDLREVLYSAYQSGARIPPWFSLYVMTEVLEGLVCAHGLTDEQGRPRNLIHRDISPSNVFISRQGDVKLGDFGVAKDATQPSTTRHGELKGKITYMSPEQARGRTMDQRTDVFAAGIVLWECLTQRRLFKGKSDIDSMIAILRAPRFPPSHFMSDIPPGLDKLVLDTLEVDLERRTPNAQALLDGLRQILHTEKPNLAPQQVTDALRTLLVQDGSAAKIPIQDVRRAPNVTGSFNLRFQSTDGGQRLQTADLPEADPTESISLSGFYPNEEEAIEADAKEAAMAEAIPLIAARSAPPGRHTAAALAFALAFALLVVAGTIALSRTELRELEAVPETALSRATPPPEPEPMGFAPAIAPEPELAPEPPLDLPPRPVAEEPRPVTRASAKREPPRARPRPAREPVAETHEPPAPKAIPAFAPPARNAPENSDTPPVELPPIQALEAAVEPAVAPPTETSLAPPPTAAPAPKPAPRPTPKLVRAQLSASEQTLYDLTESRCGKCHGADVVFSSIVTGKSEVTGRAFEGLAIKERLVRCVRLPHSDVSKDDALEILRFIQSMRSRFKR